MRFPKYRFTVSATVFVCLLAAPLAAAQNSVTAQISEDMSKTFEAMSKISEMIRDSEEIQKGLADLEALEEARRRRTPVERIPRFQAPDMPVEWIPRFQAQDMPVERMPRFPAPDMPVERIPPDGLSGGQDDAPPVQGPSTFL